jgi:hypothetical protein
MTPRNWYLAAAAIVALIVAAAIDLAVVSTDEPHQSAAARPAPSASQISSSTSPVAPSEPAITPSTPSPTPTPTRHPTTEVQPQLAANTISIPSQHVIASVDVCNIVDGGLMPPTDVQRTCYWAGGAPLTAAGGTTVITGHNVSVGNGKGAFGNIARLQAGDTVFTSGARARVTRWRVVRVTYRPKSAGIDTAAFVGHDGPRRLYLITGGGAYDAVQGYYVDNVYVLATRA